MHISQRGSKQALVGKAVIFVRMRAKEVFKKGREQITGKKSWSGGKEGKERCRLS